MGTRRVVVGGWTARASFPFVDCEGEYGRAPGHIRISARVGANGVRITSFEDHVGEPEK